MKRLALLLVLCLGCTPPPPQLTIPYDAKLRDGTVIFWEGGLLVKPILRNTDSDITHAAIVLYRHDGPWVYEAVPPCVQRVPLADYQKMMAKRLRESRKPMSWYIMQPMNSYTTHELVSMKVYADSQLGRPYMLRGWWKGREVRGIFCSQYIGDIVEQSGKIKSDNFHESPGSLRMKLSSFYGELSAP